MARPRKDGLDYFPHDCGASGDDRMAQFTAIYGLAGHGFYFSMLERVYRAPGGELKISEDLKRLWCKQMSITNKVFDQFMTDATRIGLFSKDEFKKNKIITSAGIKQRFAVVSRKREANRTVSATETPQEQHRNPAETPERKEKEIKENESRGNGSAQHPSIPFRLDTARKKAEDAYPIFLEQIKKHFYEGRSMAISDDLSCAVFRRLTGDDGATWDTVKEKLEANTLEGEFIDAYSQLELKAFEMRARGVRQ